MKRKILKLLLFLAVIVICYLSCSNNTLALTDNIYNGEVIDLPYYYTHHRNNEYFWDTFRYIRRASDGGELYCIEPLVHIKSDAVYDIKTDNFTNFLSIDEATFDKISKIAYYGYSYRENGIDHTDPKWYVATQMMIWRLADPSVEVYFTRSIRGPRDDSVLQSEIAEIERLVLEHDTLPAFENFPESMYIKDSLTLTDNNNVLNKYKVSNVKGGNVTINNNNLKLTSTSGNNIKFSLTKTSNKYNEPVSLYYSNESQTALRRGNLKAIKKDYKISVTMGRIIIKKIDDDTNSNTPLSEEASLAGAVFGIYNMDGTKLLEVTTGFTGAISTGYLPRLGDFYIEEISPSKGYEINNTKYKVTLSPDNLYPIVEVREKIIKRKVKLLKLYEGNNIHDLIPEGDVEFEVKNKNTNKTYMNITTDENGEANFELPYGSYIIKQKNTISGYEKCEDFEITVDENNKEEYIKYILNTRLQARIKVVKRDLETNLKINEAGFKFKIYDTINKKYICENETCTFETNAHGEFYTLTKFPKGEYELREIDVSNLPYVLNSTPLKFEVGENMNLVSEALGDVLELNFYNEPVKGEIIISKTGEKLLIENGGYKYESIPLQDVLYELRAQEDIYSNGIKIYSKGDLLETLRTDALGEVISKKLPLGKYFLREISSSGGNIADEKIYKIDLNMKNATGSLVIENLRMKNFLPKGKLIFKKKDFSTNVGLKDALIEIYTENHELVFRGLTDQKGEIRIDNLPIQKYYLIEKEAPKGYELNSILMEFRVTKNEEVVTLEMFDKKISESTDAITPPDKDNDKDQDNDPDKDNDEGNEEIKDQDGINDDKNDDNNDHTLNDKTEENIIKIPTASIKDNNEHYREEQLKTDSKNQYFRVSLPNTSKYELSPKLFAVIFLFIGTLLFLVHQKHNEI